MSQRRLAEKVIVNFLAMAVECSSAAVQSAPTEAERERLLAMCHPSKRQGLQRPHGQECEHDRIAKARLLINIRSYARRRFLRLRGQARLDAVRGKPWCTATISVWHKPVATTLTNTSSRRGFSKLNVSMQKVRFLADHAGL